LSDPSAIGAAAISPRAAFRQGVRELMPAAPGVFAWGLVTGVAMVKSGLNVPESIALSLIAYAGSAQLAALPLMASFAPIWLIFVTAVIVNLRFVVYSVMMRSHLAGLSMGKRIGLGFLVGDIMFARFSALLEREPHYPQRVAYYFGGACCNWMWWQVSSIIGIVAATGIPMSWGLELAGTLTLVALLVPLCRQWPVLAGAVIAAVTSVVAHDLPLRLGLPLGILLGVITAFFVERRRGAA
jgi:predicted branched-subunit amino acid permease